MDFDPLGYIFYSKKDKVGREMTGIESVLTLGIDNYVPNYTETVDTCQLQEICPVALNLFSLL